MTYNIVKEMSNKTTGKQTHVLLTDGLSEIWEIKGEKEATNIAKLMTQNSDSGWVYRIRKNCK